MLTNTIESILKTIQNREGGSRWGIGVAAQYLAEIGNCLNGNGNCPTKAFGLASAEVWAKQLKEAADRLTFCSPPEDEDWFKNINDGASISDGAILEYDAVLMTRAKDRDGDILEPKGLRVDTAMPLLWQHMQMQPIGKLVKVLSQDDDKISTKFAIADTELGRDAATLVRFGALRKSHGFKPSLYEPVEIVKGSDGQNYAKGWHIKEGDCFEGSLVSIPANGGAKVTAVYGQKSFDGLCTAFSRGFLKTTGVQLWAKSWYDQRPTIVAGFSTKDASTAPAEEKGMGKCCGKDCKKGAKCPDCGNMVKGDVNPTMMGSDTPNDGGKCPLCADGKLDSTGSCPQCGYVKGKSINSIVADAVTLAVKSFGDKIASQISTKDVGGLSTKYIDGSEIDGSYESVTYGLSRTSKNYLLGKGVDGLSNDSYCTVVATFPGKAIVSAYNYGSGSKDRFFEVAYTMNGTKAVFSGEPAEVKIEPTIIPKMLENLGVKSFGPRDTSPLTNDQSIDEMVKALLKKAGNTDEIEVQKAIAPVLALNELLQQAEPLDFVGN